MTRVSAPPYQTEKHLHLHEHAKDAEDRTHETGRDHGDYNLAPSTLPKIFKHELSRVSTESLHSYSFVNANLAMIESRQNILKRSIDFMKSKIKGWKLPAMHQGIFPSASTSDIILPSEPIRDGAGRPKSNFVDNNTVYATIPSLHSPTRFAPQNQAIITTDTKGNILNANDIACLIFGYAQSDLCSLKALDLIADPFRDKQQRVLASRLQDSSNDEMVLACGKIIPIIKKNKETSAAASLWLKETCDDCGNAVFIWIFEEIPESIVTAEINEKGIILKASGDVKQLYGYAPDELIGLHVITLIPALKQVSSKSGEGDGTTDNSDNEESFYENLDIEQINRTKYYGSRSKDGGSFPIIGKVSCAKAKVDTAAQLSPPFMYQLKVISIPTIAGVITAHATGIVQACNSDFVKYLFGVASHELIGKRSINSLLPQFPRLIEFLRSELKSELKSERALVEGMVISENAFRHAASMISTSSAKILYTHKDNSTVAVQGPSGIIAVHRDGTEFDVDIQMRVVKSPDEPLHALWITYDRSVNGAAGLGEEKEDDRKAAPKDEEQEQEQEQKVEEEEEEGKFRMSEFIAAGGKPPNTTASSGGTIIDVTTPPNLSPLGEQPFDPNLYSAITFKKSIDDFVIVADLGQGAYGQVKLGYDRGDSLQKKVVLKYVVKARILVDCWIRDGALGTVPLEIHILHTLRSIPHPNIVQMVDYFKDDDHYYIEMGLHGVGMDLFDYIELNTSMPESEVKSIFRQIARAIQHLHKNKIVHRDIKDENVILDKNGNVQLIDFGSSTYIKEGKKFDTFCGTLDYAAPEVLTGKKYDGPQQDIWALGILLYTLIYKENPFYNIDEIIARELRIPYILSEGSIDLVKKMLNRDVDLRPTIDDVLDHPWLREDS